MAGWPAGRRSSACGIHSWICDRGYIRGRQLEELRGPAEGLSDGAARQLIVVGLIPRPFPCPAAWWKRSERRLWHRPPRPDRKSTRLNSSHDQISYAVFCLKKKKRMYSQRFVLKKKKNI